MFIGILRICTPSNPVMLRTENRYRFVSDISSQHSKDSRVLQDEEVAKRCTTERLVMCRQIEW